MPPRRLTVPVKYWSELDKHWRTMASVDGWWPYQAGGTANIPMTAAGVASLGAIGLEPSRESAYVLSGDIHHYERSREGATVHVVAGGGQLKPSGISPVGYHQAGARQALQNLREELLRAFRRFRQAGATGACVRRLPG